MKRLWIFMIFAPVLIFSGCDDNYRYHGIYAPYVPPENPIITFQDSTTLQNMPRDAATITRIAISRDALIMTIRTGGGCRPHEYTLYGDIRFIESYPVQANIYLAHDANNDPCDAIIQTTEEFNLSPLKRSYLAAYRGYGPIILRIHEPGKSEPLLPYIVYNF